eukprot:3869516-Rhodomonas_salina.2
MGRNARERGGKGTGKRESERVGCTERERVVRAREEQESGAWRRRWSTVCQSVCCDAWQSGRLCAVCLACVWSVPRWGRVLVVRWKVATVHV